MEGKRDSEKAAQTVAQIWSNSLLPNERGAGYQFYMNALQSWLSNKTANTRRSYAGTLVNFFDFASRRRSSGGDTIQLVAPHQLNQSDVDEYVAHLSKPSFNPETLTNKSERVVYEWLLDYLKDKPEVMASSAKSKMSKEGIDVLFPDYVVKKGFLASPRRGFTKFDYVISALARKSLVSKRHPIEDDPTADPDADYPIGLVPPKSVRQPSTQIQRLQALSSFWSHLLTDKKLGMSRRPGALEPVNPWTEASRLTAKAAPDNQIRKAARKMSVADLEKVSNKLAAERLDIKDPGFIGLKNILATRDELAVFFYTSTGLRRQEGMMARVENLKDTSIGSGKLLLLGGIRRKGRKSDEEVFVPMYVLRLRQHLYSLLKKYVDETEQYTRWVKENNDPDGGDVKMALMRRGHFQKAFLSALQHADRGPLIPALGRWGNAVYKAQEKGKEESVALFGVDLTQVPMDGRNLLHRMQLLARGKEDRKLRYHPHALRHLSVTMAEGVGDGSRLAQAIAGHRSASTTDIYRDMVSLQAAAVLKVDEKLEEIFARADALARGQAPVRVKEGESAVEAPVVEIKPVEEAEKPTEVEISEISPREAAVSEFYEHPSVKAVIEEVKKNLNEFVEKSQVAADAVLSSGPKENIQTTTASKIENVQVQKGISAVGQRLPGERAPKRPANRKPAAVQDVLDAIPPEKFFLKASDWPPGGRWESPVYVNRENMDRIVASGMFVGPSAVTQWGFPSAKSGKKGESASFKDMDALGMFSSPRTYLTYRVAVNRATEIKSEFSDERLGVFTPQFLKRNPVPEEAVKKEFYSVKRKIERRSERLVYFPICNVSDGLWMTELADRAVGEHEKISLIDPGAAKSMVRWMAVLFQLGKSSMALLSENIPKGGGGEVSWIGEEDTVSLVDETTYQCFRRTRGSTFRQHSVNEVIEFLKVEGVRNYSGELGTEFRFSDKEKLTNTLITRIEKNLDDMEAFQEMEVSSFLHVYPLPPWVVETDDALGDEKHGLSEEERSRAKDWFRTISREFGRGKMVEFEFSAMTFRDFFPLTMKYILGGPDVITVEYPEDPTLKRSISEFFSKRGIDPIVGCRRFMRHLWEIKKTNEGAFLGGRTAAARAREDIDKIDQMWGLLWSWIIPTMGSFKNHIEMTGKPAVYREMKDLMQRYMSATALQSRVLPLEKELESFKRSVEDVMLSTSMSPDEKIQRMDKFAMDIVRQKAQLMIESGVSDPESFAQAIFSAYVDHALEWSNAVGNPNIFRDMADTIYFSGAVTMKDVEKAFDSYVGAEFTYLMLLSFFSYNAQKVFETIVGKAQVVKKIEDYEFDKTYEGSPAPGLEDQKFFPEAKRAPGSMDYDKKFGSREKKRTGETFITPRADKEDEFANNIEALISMGEYGRANDLATWYPSPAAMSLELLNQGLAESRRYLSESKEGIPFEKTLAKGIIVRKAKDERPKKAVLDEVSEEITRLYEQVSGTDAFEEKDRELGLSDSFRNLSTLNPIKKRRLLNELIKLSEMKPNRVGQFSKSKTSPILQSNLDLVRGIRLSMVRLVCALYADPTKPEAARRPGRGHPVRLHAGCREPADRLRPKNPHPHEERWRQDRLRREVYGGLHRRDAGRVGKARRRGGEALLRDQLPPQNAEATSEVLPEDGPPRWRRGCPGARLPRVLRHRGVPGAMG